MSLTQKDEDTLTRCRAEIDNLNKQLLNLLESRGRLVEAITALKRHHHIPIHDPDREEAMLAAVLTRTRGPYSRNQIERVFRCIFEMSRALAASSRD